MKIWGFYRLTRCTVSSSFRDAIHGPTLRQYHDCVPLAKGYVDTRPMSLVGAPTANESFREMNRQNELLWRRPSKVEILGPGMILFDNYISLKDQVDIVNICEKWGNSPGGLYKPAELQSYMMCFGRNWDPITGYKNRYQRDGSEPPPLPHKFIALAEAAVQDAQTHLNDLPSMCPDNCLVNFYPTNGRWELHQDRDESSDSLKRGLPVVIISIGEVVEIRYGLTRDQTKSERIFMESGDVLIFGGKSRLIYHGVTQVARFTIPLPLRDETGYRFGRLSLTLRQS